MLKGISPVISPDLIKVLMEMGHGDELVIADGNFPSASIAQRSLAPPAHPARTDCAGQVAGVVRADGLGCPVLVERFAFYERAKKAYAVLATSEMALYANIILKKGVIKA